MTNEKIKFTKKTQVIFFNLKATPIQQMLDYDILCKKEIPSVAAIVHPGRKGFHKAFFGTKEILIPIYESIRIATKKQPQAEVMINFSSFRSAYQNTKEALEQQEIKSIFIVAEGIPERQTRELLALAKEKNKLIVGPSSVGGIIAGKLRIGYAGGKNENIINSRLYKSGSVGLVSKSGGMMNELFSIISQTTDGINEGIAIGGDAYPGSTLLNHILRYENNPNIKLIIALSELGGKNEFEIIKAKQENKITKPIIMWVTGTCASIFPYEVQFGHAGAKSGKERESAKFKNKSLKEAGIIVPESFAKIQETIKKQFELLKEEGKITMIKENQKQEQTGKSELPTIPKDYNEALKEGLIRKKTNITSTISSDLGEEPTYNKIKISKIIDNYSIGKIIGLLWFKKELPDHFTKFLDQCILITADHGPAVSGAHNSIIAARAGKDIISSLCSGLLTIGPRFGGAIDAASRYFKKACDSNQPANLFVKDMKKNEMKIPGIGHKIKSSKNPDKRVELLKKLAKDNFPNTKYLNYALEIEKVTLQ
ncbi:MAG TPA: ATP citrate synthase, partial [Dehalococcoidia bacterium]|nr:ATP citrate synthase [Dehalococcoidia bacterium]